MQLLLYAIVSAAVAEGIFVVGFMLTAFLFSWVHCSLVLLFRVGLSDRIRALVSGFLCGLAATIGACAVALLIAGHVGVAADQHDRPPEV